MIGSPISALPFIKSNRMRGIAVTSAVRSKAMPELPTVAESGLPGYDVVAWFGMLAPTGTPKEIVNRLTTEIRKLVQTKAMSDALIAQGADPLGSTAEEFQAKIKSDIDKWTRTIKAAGVKAE